MSDRIKQGWKVLRSVETIAGDYCVDIFMREDNTYGFEEFRRDTEDMGRWTGINYYSALSFVSEAEALHAAESKIAWLAECV